MKVTKRIELLGFRKEEVAEKNKEANEGLCIAFAVEIFNSPLI